MRWTNVAAALAVAGILGLMVGWPLLEPKAPAVPPPVGTVSRAPAAPTNTPTAAPRKAPRRESFARPQRPRVVAAPKVRQQHQVRKQARAVVTTPVATVAPAPAPVIAAPAPAPAREFSGFER